MLLMKYVESGEPKWYINFATCFRMTIFGKCSFYKSPRTLNISALSIHICY